MNYYGNNTKNWNQELAEKHLKMLKENRRTAKKGGWYYIELSGRIKEIENFLRK